MPPTRRIKYNRTLGPNGITPENWCETEINVHKTDYLWIIHDYDFHQTNLPKGESLKSPLFSPTANKKSKWFLRIYPNGDAKNEVTSKNDFSLYLYLDSTDGCSTALAYCKLSILKENKKIELCREIESVRKYVAGGNGWGFSEFFENDYELPSDNKLTIYCEIDISMIGNSTNSINHSHSNDPIVPELRLSEDLRQLLESEEFSDVVISVKGKNYKAHKSILSTRSPVFAAMFKHQDMEENQQNKVNIKDFDQPTVQEMLNYIYTGRSENLNKLADRLLVIAEKYGLEGLKDISERMLVENLSTENAIDMLIFADLHQAQKLKSGVVNFIGEKSAELIGTPAWKKTVVSHPQLVIEVYEALRRK